jgi:hypothetical protein
LGAGLTRVIPATELGVLKPDNAADDRRTDAQPDLPSWFVDKRGSE